MKAVILTTVILIFSVAFVSAALQVGTSTQDVDEDKAINLITPTPPAVTNNTISNVNSSSYWGTYFFGDYDMPTIKLFGYNQTLGGDDRFVNIDGDNMTGPLQIQNNGGLFINSTTTGFSIPDYPVGTSTPLLMWIPNKGAFRAGNAVDGLWNESNIGLDSFATGEYTEASGDFSTALGDYAVARGDKSFATSYGTALGTSSVAMGYNSFTSGASFAGYALGTAANVSAVNGIAIGNTVKTTGDGSMALGKGFTVSDEDVLGIGWKSMAVKIDGSLANWQSTHLVTLGGMNATKLTTTGNTIGNSSVTWTMQELNNSGNSSFNQALTDGLYSSPFTNTSALITPKADYPTALNISNFSTPIYNTTFKSNGKFSISFNSSYYGTPVDLNVIGLPVQGAIVLNTPLSYIYIAPVTTNPLAYVGYFSSTGFSYAGDKGMTFGTSSPGKSPVIWGETSYQTDGTNNMQDIYIGVSSEDYAAGYLKSRTILVGDAGNYTKNRFIPAQPAPSILWLPPQVERNVYGGIHHDNLSFNIYTTTGKNISLFSGDKVNINNSIFAEENLTVDDSALIKNDLNVTNNVYIKNNIHIDGNLSVKRPYWTGYDNSTQGLINVNNVQVINISNNNDYDSYGIKVVGSQNLTFDHTGDYQCTLSPEFYEPLGQSGVITFWYQKCIGGTCTDVKWSNSRYTLSSNTYNAPSIIYQFDIETPATDAVRFMWWSDNANTVIYSSGALTSPTRPSIPGVLLTCLKVSEITP